MPMTSKDAPAASGDADQSAVRRDHISRAVAQMSRPLAVFDAGQRLVFVNRAAIELLRLPEHITRPGTTMRDYARHGETRGAYGSSDFEHEFERRLRTPRLRMEYTTPEGTTIQLERDQLEQGGYAVLYTDVTEQRRAEAALQRSEARYRTIVEDQGELILRCDGEGLITFVNMACCQFHGLPRMRMLGRRVTDLVYEEDRDGVAPFFAPRRDDEERAREIEHRAWRHDGELRWLRRRDRVIQNRPGEILEFQSVINDVTDIRAAEAQISQFSALAILGQVSAGVTHELNQPLNAASMGVQNVLMRMGEDNSRSGMEIRSRIEKVLEQIERMGAIVNHLRTFIQPTSRGGVSADLRGIIEFSIDMVRHHLVVDEIDISVSAPDACAPVPGDKIQLEIILTNLLTNAHASILRRRRAEGGDASSERGRIAISVSSGDSAVEMRIADNGAGIPKEALDRIFDPFFTTQEVGGGMGLGLSLAYRIVTGLGGTISAANLARGAEFTVVIPTTSKENPA